MAADKCNARAGSVGVEGRPVLGRLVYLAASRMVEAGHARTSGGSGGG